jgi:hypothetical protein
MAFKNRTTVVKWLRKFGNFDWENQTPFTMSKCQNKDHVSLAKVKFRETEVLFLNDRPVRDKKAII